MKFILSLWFFVSSLSVMATLFSVEVEILPLDSKEIPDASRVYYAGEDSIHQELIATDKLIFKFSTLEMQEIGAIEAYHYKYKFGSHCAYINRIQINQDFRHMEFSSTLLKLALNYFREILKLSEISLVCSVEELRAGTLCEKRASLPELTEDERGELALEALEIDEAVRMRRLDLAEVELTEIMKEYPIEKFNCVEIYRLLDSPPAIDCIPAFSANVYTEASMPPITLLSISEEMDD